MTDQERNIVSKLEIISEMAQNIEVKQLANVMREYIKAGEKGQLGFVSKDDNDNPTN